jgi:hypothetical protein
LILNFNFPFWGAIGPPTKRVPFEVSSSGPELRDVIAKVPQTQVAGMAQQPPHTAGFVIVVDALGRSAADLASTRMLCEQDAQLLDGDVEVACAVMAAMAGIPTRASRALVEGRGELLPSAHPARFQFEHGHLPPGIPDPRRPAR